MSIFLFNVDNIIQVHILCLVLGNYELLSHLLWQWNVFAIFTVFTLLINDLTSAK